MIIKFKQWTERRSTGYRLKAPRRSATIGTLSMSTSMSACQPVSSMVRHIIGHSSSLIIMGKPGGGGGGPFSHGG